MNTEQKEQVLSKCEKLSENNTNLLIVLNQMKSDQQREYLPQVQQIIASNLKTITNMLKLFTNEAIG